MSDKDQNKSFTIFPAIDLKGGRVVRLSQGRADRETVYYEDPLVPARKWKDAGCDSLHVVDLDGAFQGVSGNHEALETLAQLGLFLQLGGGIRSEKDAVKAFSRGVSRVVLGTKALEDRDFLKRMLDKFGEKIAVGIDAKGGKVATRGWVDVSEKEALEFAGEVMELGVKSLIYTDISTDGMLTGPNVEAQRAMATMLPDNVQLIASGGVSKISDIRAMRKMHKELHNPRGVIIGRALYEGRFEISEALAG